MAKDNTFLIVRLKGQSDYFNSMCDTLKEFMKESGLKRADIADWFRCDVVKWRLATNGIQI